MSSGHETAPVEIYTPDCRYRGALVSRGYRITDVLNESTTSLVELRDVTVSLIRSRLSANGQAPRGLRCSQLWLKKADILLAVPLVAHEAPGRRATHYQAKNQYPALVALGGCVLSGILHSARPIAPPLLLAEDSPLAPFFAMTEVTVHASDGTLGQSHYDVLILQRSAVDAGHIAQQPVSTAQDHAARSASSS